MAQAKENQTGQKKAPRYDIWFLVITAAAFLLVLVVRPSIGLEALVTVGGIFRKLIPILILVWLLMALIAYFLPMQRMKSVINNSRGGWALAIGGGILSSGPIYAWYPMLKELRDHGVRQGFIATFLYNRAIKVPLLPVVLTYFGMLFVGTLLVVMVFASLVQGVLLEWLLPDTKGEK